MGNVSLLKLLSLNIKDIEDLFGKEKLAEMLHLLGTHEKIIEMNVIEKKLKELERARFDLAKELERSRMELENIKVNY